MELKGECKYQQDEEQLNQDGISEPRKIKMAILVAKGFTQVKEIDYEETFAPTAKLKSERTLLTIAAKKGWKVYQDDVPSA